MIIGVPRETKPGERRIALLPEAVQAITGDGHDVQVETRAGQGIGIDDDAYRAAGADVVTRRDAWDAELVVTQLMTTLGRSSRARLRADTSAPTPSGCSSSATTVPPSSW